VNVAEESTELARFNILVQAGTSMLAQANSSPQMALKLLQ
jgi:flagellin